MPVARVGQSAEHGRPRQDDGPPVMGLTEDRELILDPGTYFGRSTVSGRMPGALVEDFRFTL